MRDADSGCHPRPPGPSTQLHARCVLLIGLPQMHWDVFHVGELAVPLEKAAEIIRDSLSREVAGRCLPTCINHYLVDEIAPILLPFVEEIKDVVELGDLLDEVFLLHVNRLIESFECRRFLLS
jgi:hypothetical protein